jgi:hypothetical protein
MFCLSHWISVLVRQEASSHCTFPSREHQSLWLEYDDELARRAVAWFDQWLARGRNSDPHLPLAAN